MDAIAEQSVEYWYRHYYPVIMNKCTRMLRSRAAAQDVAQETFIRLWQKGPRAGSVEVMTAWIYRTSTRLAIDHMRAGKKRGDKNTDANAAENDDAASGTDTGNAEASLHFRQQLAELSQSLPTDLIEVAVLHRLDGLSCVEIAEVLGKNERTVRRRLERLDEHLKQYQQKWSHHG